MTKPEGGSRFYDRYLEKSIWRHNPAMDCLITIKFGRLKQNHMPGTKHRTKSKSKVKFPHGGRAFYETGNSFISAVDWVILSKFCMQIDFYLLKRMHSVKLYSVVAVRLYGRHLEKSIWRHKSADNHLIKTKFGRLTQNHMPMTTHRSNSKQEIEFQYGGRLFSETGSSFISTVDWDISSKFGMQIDFCLLKQVHRNSVKCVQKVQILM